MTRIIPATAAEARMVLGARETGFPGFVVDRSPSRASDAPRLREHLGEGPLSGPVLDGEQLAERERQHAEDMTAEAVELERRTMAAVPLEERFAGYPETLKLLGLSEPAEPDPLPSLDRTELGPEMRRFLRGQL